MSVLVPRVICRKTVGLSLNKKSHVAGMRRGVGKGQEVPGCGAVKNHSHHQWLAFEKLADARRHEGKVQTSAAFPRG